MEGILSPRDRRAGVVGLVNVPFLIEPFNLQRLSKITLSEFVQTFDLSLRRLNLLIPFFLTKSNTRGPS